MIVTPLPGRGSEAVRSALLSEGWEGTSAGVSAAGLEPWAYRISGLPKEALEALLPVAANYGLDLLTGADWAVLAGTRARLSAMARSWTLPPELAELAVCIGQGLPADPPEFWRVRSGPVDLTGGPILLVTAPAAGTRVVVPGDYLECRPAASDTGAAAAEARAAGTGLLLSFGSPAEALDHLERALGAAHLAALDPVCMAVDPGWGPGRGEHDLARFRAFGVPLVTTTDHPAVAAMAWERGCRLFRTGAAAEVLAALEMTITLLP